MWQIVTWDKKCHYPSDFPAIMFLFGVKKNCTAPFLDAQELHSWSTLKANVCILLNISSRNFLWSKKYFWLCCRSNVKWVEVPKVSDTFWAKLYCKICDLFCQFLLALRLSARKSEIEKETQIKSTGMSEKI